VTACWARRWRRSPLSAGALALAFALRVVAGGLLIAAAMRIARARDLGTGTLSFTGW
jgi:hypothetical protein